MHSIPNLLRPPVRPAIDNPKFHQYGFIRYDRAVAAYWSSKSEKRGAYHFHVLRNHNSDVLWSGRLNHQLDMKKVFIYESEIGLRETLDRYDKLLRECAKGDLPFWDFYEKYDNFYWAYALDSHESDPEEKILLRAYHERIEPHKMVQEDILALVCSDEDSEKEQYRRAGRISAKEAVKRIAEVVTTYLKTT